MNILYLTNGFPFPLTSGYLRHYFLIKELAEDHDVTLLSMIAPSYKEEDREALEPFTKEIITFRSGGKGGSLPKKVIRRLKSVAQPDAFVAKMRTVIDRLVAEQHFDVVISGKRTMDAIAHLNIPIVADMCDATSSRIQRSMAFATTARKPMLMLEYQQMKQTEKSFMKRAEHSIFISSRDREDLIGSRIGGTTIVPNGVDLDFWRRRTAVRQKNQIVFTGAMDYRPNTDAALYLIEEILPLVQKEVPDVELFIVGRDPTAGLKEAGKKHANVTVTGFVDDVRDYLDEATVFAAPLRFGAGLQNKVLEAMAMEVPVVASPLAADGLRTEEGAQPPVDIVTGTEQFAQRLIQKLRDAADEPEPHYAGRLFIETHFVWNYSRQKLNQVIEQVAGVPAFM
ncbi:MAG: glycosyltransferase [Chloroflexota bacterium]